MVSLTWFRFVRPASYVNVSTTASFSCSPIIMEPFESLLSYSAEKISDSITTPAILGSLVYWSPIASLNSQSPHFCVDGHTTQSSVQFLSNYGTTTTIVTFALQSRADLQCLRVFARGATPLSLAKQSKHDSDSSIGGHFESTMRAATISSAVRRTSSQGICQRIW